MRLSKKSLKLELRHPEIINNYYIAHEGLREDLPKEGNEMSYTSIAGLQSFRPTLLRAKPLAHTLPALGSGMKMFDPQPQAVGNSRLQMQPTDELLKIVS